MPQLATQHLRIIYGIAVVHSVFMVAWCVGSVFFHERMKRFETSPGGGYMPHRLFSKYEGHTLVYATHIAPAIFWSLCVPFQFHPQARRRFPRCHRYLGRVFIGTSFLMVVGVVVIVHRGLTWERFVNGDDGAHEENAYAILLLPGSRRYSWIDLALAAIAGVFAYTAWVAVGHARRRERREHQIWMIRHVGWGLWVVSQRILIGAVLGPVFRALYGTDGAFHARGRHYAFAGSGVAGILVSVGMAEYAIALLRRKQQ